MQQNYQDAMAIVAKYGKPDLFLTLQMAAQHPDRQADTADAMHHRLSTAQRNYHSMSVKEGKKAMLAKTVGETLEVNANLLDIS